MDRQDDEGWIRSPSASLLVLARLDEEPGKIFVCGCSYTIGPGLDAEETWASLQIAMAARLEFELAVRSGA